MFHLIGQIIVGALFGWIGSIITKDNDSMGAIKNIAAGLIGSFIGGYIPFLQFGPSLAGMRIIPSLLGAIIVIVIAKLIFGKKK